MALDFKNYTFYNWTPHSVDLYDSVSDELIMSVPSDGVIRLIEKTHKYDSTFGFPVHVVRYAGPDTDLPSQAPDVFHIMSRDTARGFPGRTDILFPYPLRRDKDKRINGCYGLGMFPYMPE